MIPLHDMNNNSTSLRRGKGGPDYLETENSIERFKLVDLTVQTPTSREPPANISLQLAPPRWRTLEFRIYGLLFLLVVPLMVYSPVQLSQESHPNYTSYRFKLSKGWIGGRLIDNSDPQYRSFRSNLFILTALAVSHVVLSQVYAMLVSRMGSRAAGKRSDTLHRIPFMAGFAVILTVALHGSSALKVFFIIAINYTIAKRLAGSTIGSLIIWTLNLVILFANEIYDGYNYSSIHSAFAFLDTYRGFYPRWHISFNITMLRLLSFSIDYRWALLNETPSSVPLNARQRSSHSHPLVMYNFVNYLAYTLYSPLYIAGPIMSFNDFIWQMRRPINIDRRSIFGYAIRFVVCLLTMELILHYMYVVAIKDTKSWYGATPMELCMIGFWNLIIVWLKLLLPWRFFRLWALADGILPPENMIRCMANNYTVGGFWRGWHRSYNQWLIRYIYVPLGGSANVILATLVSFTFVALWHDLKLRLLAWGWLVTLFVIPELVLSKVFTRSKFGDQWWYRHLRAIGGVGNVLMLMIANLVGFVIGLEGIKYLGTQLMGSWSGIGFIFLACGCLFVGVQVMLEYREEEKRSGVYRKC
ncbi:putative GUP1-Multimembrane-spanning protein essential for proton symport of glycerol [Serendipita vermifera]|nr:putative GUP1-Multimembrane-spanning protein essential for proton symport of glycerol [Serendipita vermifera]